VFCYLDEGINSEIHWDVCRVFDGEESLWLVKGAKIDMN
jgi:hypothetical protein